MGKAERRLGQQQEADRARIREAFDADRRATYVRMKAALQEFYAAMRDAEHRLQRKDYDAPGAALFEFRGGFGFQRKIAVWEIWSGTSPVGHYSPDVRSGLSYPSLTFYLARGGRLAIGSRAKGANHVTTPVAWGNSQLKSNVKDWIRIIESMTQTLTSLASD